MRRFDPRGLCGAALLFLMTSVGAAGARAQMTAGSGVTIGAGVRLYEAPEEGEESPAAVLVSLRTDFQASRTLMVEFASSLADPRGDDIGVAATSVFEAQAQLQYPGERFAPYAGVGLGFAWTRDEDDRSDSAPAVSVGVGLRAAVTRPLHLVADLRLRGLSGFDHPHFDATVGLRLLPWASR